MTSRVRRYLGADSRLWLGRSEEMILTVRRPSSSWSIVASCRASCGGHTSSVRAVAIGRIGDRDLIISCRACGTGGRLLAGICRRCQLRRQLGELLAGPGGQVRPELRVLHDTLASAERPATALTWLKRAATRTVLAELAAGQRPLSHAALDDLPPGKPIEHLRSVLVATAALPARDEQLARIERWVSQAVSEHAGPEDKELLHRYAAWHLLRRLRQRNRGASTTYGQLDTVRQRVRAALGLLGWLRERGLTLASCSQADLDAWLASKNATRKAEAGHFVRWAISHGINRNLQFAATRWTGPAGPLDQDERWQQARRLLHDDTLDTGDRVAGLLVLLYAQRAAAISRLTPDDLDTSDGTVKLHLGSVPVVLPEPVATLARDLAGTRRGHAVLGDHGTSRWLFPGGQRRQARRAAPPARPAARASPLDGVVPAGHRATRRRPGTPARHPHQGRRRLAARLCRGLDQLRRRRQPPPGTLTRCQDCPNSTSPASAAGAGNASPSMPATRSGWNATSALGT